MWGGQDWLPHVFEYNIRFANSGSPRQRCMGVPPIQIELLTSISGVDFESCYAEKETVEIEAASGRAKDLADLENLPR